LSTHAAESQRRSERAARQSSFLLARPQVTRPNAASSRAAAHAASTSPRRPRHRPGQARTTQGILLSREAAPPTISRLRGEHHVDPCATRLPHWPLVSCCVSWHPSIMAWRRPTKEPFHPVLPPPSHRAAVCLPLPAGWVPVYKNRLHPGCASRFYRRPILILTSHGRRQRQQDRVSSAQPVFTVCSRAVLTLPVQS
jgi:hypothetical protein